MENIADKIELGIEKCIPFYSSNDSDYRIHTAKGEVFLRDKKIVVGGLVRNGEAYLSENINHLCDILKISKDFRIVIYENDSEDNTKDVLKKLADSNSKIQYTSETNNRPMFGQVKNKERITALAEYRNKVLETIKTQYSDFDYVIIVDLDFKQLPAKSLYNSFGHLANIQDDCMGISGFTYEIKRMNENMTMLWNYDCWAHRSNWWHDLDYFQRLDIPVYSMYWFGYMTLPIGMTPYVVNSNFGAMAIYRLKDYIQGEYSDIDCEHVSFHYSLRSKLNHVMLANPSQVMLCR